MPRDAVVGSVVLVAVGLVLDCLLHIVVSGRGSSDCPRVVLLVVVLLTCYGATKHWLVTLLLLLATTHLAGQGDRYSSELYCHS